MEGVLAVREKVIEQRLVRAVKAAGGLCPKFVSPGMDGMPDRLVLLPGARLAFVEVKAPGKKPRPLQLHRHEQLRALGFRVYVLDSMEQIKPLLEEKGYEVFLPHTYSNPEAESKWYSEGLEKHALIVKKI